MVGRRVAIVVEAFVWDYGPDGNIQHLRDHEIEREDVEAVLECRASLLREPRHANLNSRDDWPGLEAEVLARLSDRNVGSRRLEAYHRLEKQPCASAARAGGTGMDESERELREELDRLKETGRELEGFVHVEERGSKNPRAVLSLRMGSDELGEVETAAATLDVNVSEFIRGAALTRARDINADASAVQDVQNKARELNEALQRLYGKSA